MIIRTYYDSQNTAAEKVTETSLVELNRDAAETDTFVLYRILTPLLTHSAVGWSEAAGAPL